MPVDTPKYWLTQWLPVSSLAEEEYYSMITIQNTLPKSRKKDLKDKKMTTMTWLIMLPGLNPIEHIWDILER